MERPLVSIIITTYNYAHTVGTAIASALAQDYANVEVVIVDNASTDATPQLVERYAADARVRYVRNPANIGMVPNHNKGLAEARGAYVLFLSADDFLLPHHVSRSLAYLRDHPDVDVLYTAAYFVNEHEHFIGLRAMSGQPLAPYAGGRNEFAGLLTEGCYMCFPTMLMNRELYERFGVLDEDIKAADYEIVIRWAANGVRFGYLPEATCVVRLHASQQSSPGNYVVDSGDAREFVYLVNKFAGAAAEKLAGYESTVSRFMWMRYQMALASGYADTDGELRALLLRTDGVLAEVKRRNADAPPAIAPVVIVLPTNQIGELERTLRSLVVQTHGAWEAIVADYVSHPYADIAGIVDPAGRMRTLRMNGVTTDGAIVNAGLRVAAGNAYVVVRAGSTLPPDHLERLVSVLQTGQGQIVRTTATLAIDHHGAPVGIAPILERADAFMPPNEPRMPFIAPFGTWESFAFTRAAIDQAGMANEGVPAFAEWEYYLRLSAHSPVVAVDSRVTSHVAATPDAFGTFAKLPSVARSIYATYPTDDASIQIERDVYLRNLERALGAGPGVAADANALAELVRAAYGTALLAGVR